jgi:formyltetrahydrofolate deformylase
MTANLVLRLRASDRPGILAKVTSLLAAQGCNIQSSVVFGDDDTGRFFCRMELASAADHRSVSELLEPVAQEMGLEIEVRDLRHKMRVLIAVSKFGHCIVDLIHKQEIGQLPIEIVGVVSNHQDLAKVAAWHGLPFHHLPMHEGKEAQETRFLSIAEETEAELIVLARYMQILSNSFCHAVEGRCINIHHSFLPSFKGAKPYHQAHSRGVKIIGATAHFVTADLDEGPIIEQDVRRVNHGVNADEMVAIGRETEASVLSRAVRWHAEHRIFQNGNKTVVL